MEERVSDTSADRALGATVPLLILVMILFALVVGYGWLRLLAIALDPLAAGFVAALITVISLLLARMIGKAWVTGNSDPGYAAKLFFLYPVLFIISALGTINAAFYNFEGSSVLEQVIDDSVRKLAALEGATRGALRDEGPRAQAAAEVERLLVQLRSEILNEQACGVGPEARKIIARIRAILPQFEEFAPGRARQSCDRPSLERLGNRYTENARAMLNIDPEFQDRIELGNAIYAPITEARRRLLAAQTELATGGGFGKGYEGAQLAIETAATAYAEGREKLAASRPAAAETLPVAVDTTRSRYLGSITAMPGTLAARLNYFTTWVYFIVAVALDFFLIFLFIEGLRTPVNSPRRPPPPMGRDPQFLWVNQGE